MPLHVSISTLMDSVNSTFFYYPYLTVLKSVTQECHFDCPDGVGVRSGWWWPGLAHEEEIYLQPAPAVAPCFFFYFPRSAFAKNRLSTFKLQFIKFSLAMLFARALVVPLFITCSTAQSEKARAEPPRIIYELLLDLRKIPPPGRWIISAGKLRHNCFFVCLILSILAGWSFFCGKIYWNLNIECLIFFPTSWNW